MTLEPNRLLLLADLCMAAQGFRPAKGRLEQLTAQGMLWQMPTKPSTFGMTDQGKRELLSMLNSLGEADTVATNDRAKTLTPSVAEFAQGVSFLDEVERSARSGQVQRPTSEQLAFLTWLVHQLTPAKPDSTKANQPGT